MALIYIAIHKAEALNTMYCGQKSSAQVLTVGQFIQFTQLCNNSNNSLVLQDSIYAQVNLNMLDSQLDFLYY